VLVRPLTPHFAPRLPERDSVPLIGYALIAGGIILGFKGCWSYVFPYEDDALYQVTERHVPTGRLVTGKEANEEARGMLPYAFVSILSGFGVFVFGKWLEEANERIRKRRGLP
ncbi:MAG TPA: hypothetical protein P5532_24565, partial [Planctomycetota bacterium]|nr:hypothetical protein [Planctomycetota bacterium]